MYVLCINIELFKYYKLLLSYLGDVFIELC